MRFFASLQVFASPPPANAPRRRALGHRGRSWPALLLIAAGAVLGCSSDDTTSTPDSGVSPDLGFVDSGVVDGAPFDITGTWASFRVSSQCFDGALGFDRVLFTWIAKHTFDQTGTDGTMTTEVCSLVLTDYSGSQSTYPPAAVAAFDARDVAIVLGGATVGSSFTTQRQGILLGWEPDSDPLDEVLPQDADDARLRDADNDTQPGVTLNVEGFVSGDVYIANRNVVISTGVIDSQDRITGTNQVTADQRVVGASAILLNNNSTMVSQDPRDDSSPFELVRLSSNLTCADIVATADQLFILDSTPTPQMCPTQ